jgi:hypothetical protein
MESWLWVDSVMDQEQRLKKKLSPPNRIDWMQQVANIGLWDNLIYNTDRNMGNLLIKIPDDASR